MTTAVAPSNYGNTNIREPETQQYDTDDNVSTTLTIQTGVSSTYTSTQGPLSRLSRHTIKLRTTSSFPNLLSLYQEPIREESNLYVEKPKKVRCKKIKKPIAEKPEFEEYHERRARQEQRQIRVDAVAKEQLEKFDEYLAKMKKKVEKQREQRQKYNDTLQERLKKQEEVERQKLRLHRKSKHVYIHDRSYLKTLPESRHCKATRLADELQRRGVLKGRADVDKYWSGFGNKQRDGVDIFAADNKTSVNYPAHWIGVRKPNITVTGDDSSLTDASSLHHQQLPPLKKRKKKKLKEAMAETL